MNHGILGYLILRQTHNGRVFWICWILCIPKITCSSSIPLRSWFHPSLVLELCQASSFPLVFCVSWWILSRGVKSTATFSVDWRCKDMGINHKSAPIIYIYTLLYIPFLAWVNIQKPSCFGVHLGYGLGPPGGRGWGSAKGAGPGDQVDLVDLELGLHTPPM